MRGQFLFFGGLVTVAVGAIGYALSQVGALGDSAKEMVDSVNKAVKKTYDKAVDTGVDVLSNLGETFGWVGSKSQIQDAQMRNADRIVVGTIYDTLQQFKKNQKNGVIKLADGSEHKLSIQWFLSWVNDFLERQLSQGVLTTREQLSEIYESVKNSLVKQPLKNGAWGGE